MNEVKLNKGEIKIKNLLAQLISENSVERKKAREELAARGSGMIEYLLELINHPRHLYRWEAIKTLEEIGDPDAIPLLIRALEDDESSIRWIAAEGLIKLGSQVVRPLLRALIEKSDSVFVLAGAHHVFYNLGKAGQLQEEFPLDKILDATKNPGGIEAVKALAYELLNKKDA